MYVRRGGWPRFDKKKGRESTNMKFCMHLSTRIQDKQNELPLINCLTDLALEADVSGFSAISLTEHHLHENQGYQNSLLFASALAPRLTQATLILATVNPAIRASATFSTSRARGKGVS
jgi:alkanesulfonate monooxygenase SsuD/methylene tetrahydromethanopterin reductase-like flavin-dependent oxidoreductase (luciferase family)